MQTEKFLNSLLIIVFTFLQLTNLGFRSKDREFEYLKRVPSQIAFLIIPVSFSQSWICEQPLSQTSMKRDSGEIWNASKVSLNSTLLMINLSLV